MRRVSSLVAVVGVLVAVGASSVVLSQGGIASAPAKFLRRRRRSSRFAPAVCSTAATGTMLSNQIVLDREATASPTSVPRWRFRRTRA